MLSAWLVTALAVIVGAERQYIAAEDHPRHTGHRGHALKQQQGEALLYEHLIQEYNQKHGIEAKKPEWHYIPTQTSHGEEEKKPVNIEHFMPHIKAGWHYIPPPPDHKKKHHHDRPINEHGPLSNLKHSQQGLHQKLIEDYRRVPDTPTHIQQHKVEHRPYVLIKPHSIPQHQVNYEVHEGHHKEAEPQIHQNIPPPPQHHVRQGEQEIFAHELHNKGHQPQILARPHVLHQHQVQKDINERFIEDKRLLDNLEHIQYHKDGHKPQVVPEQHHHHVQHGQYERLADEYKALFHTPEHNQHHQHGDQPQVLDKQHVQQQQHLQQVVDEKLIHEYGPVYSTPEQIQHHKGDNPHLPLQHHGQHEVQDKLIEQLVRSHDNSEHIYHRGQQHQPPHQHHVQEVVHERLFDDYGRFFDNPHHDHQHQIIVSNKDTLIELNRLKELSKEGEHYVRPQFDNHRLRHHELVDYLQQLLKNSVAQYNHAELKQQNHHHHRGHEIERNQYEQFRHRS